MVKNEDDRATLGPDFSKKVKVSVNFGFPGFTTLEKRKHCCQQEAGLHRRLGKGAIIPALVEKIATKIAHSHAPAAQAQRYPNSGISKPSARVLRLPMRHSGTGRSGRLTNRISGWPWRIYRGVCRGGDGSPFAARVSGTERRRSRRKYPR